MNKAFIMTDLEGVSGVNARSDGIGNKIINHEESARLLAGEVNAAVEGLIEAGVEEITVVDGHGGSNSLPIELLHPKADLMNIGDGFFPLTALPDKNYGACLHIGAHTMVGVPDGFLNHTFNSHGVANMWLNGKLVGEIAIFALHAAALGVPMILVSGDRASCREAKEFLGAVATVETKIASSRYTVINRSPTAVRKDIKEKSKAAFLDRKNIPLIKVPGSCTLRVQFMCANQTVEYEKSGWLRIDHQTIEITDHDFLSTWSRKAGWGNGVWRDSFYARNILG